MATMDEILEGTPKVGGKAPKGSQEWLEQQQEGGTTPTTPPAKGTQEWHDKQQGGGGGTTTPPPVATTPAPRNEGGANGGNEAQQGDKGRNGDGADGQTGQNESPVGGYEALYKKLNAYTPPTKEELEKERKKQKRDQLFAAIGDGVTALANLYFTTQGAPNMYTGKNTMSERTRVRYEKLKKERDEKETAYYTGLMKARQADDEAAQRERSWQRQLGLDQEARDRYEKESQHKKEREQLADERYNAEQEYKRGRDAEADRRWQATYDENKRQADRSHALRVQTQKDNKDLQEKRIRATAAKGVRGKQIGFADGEGNQVAIYENVWKGSMQQVYDAMLQDLAPSDDAERRRWERQMKKYDTPQKKEDYVKQNWHKSPKASQIMLTLSGIDPATMTSEVNSDDYSQYEEGGDDDYSQYEVK